MCKKRELERTSKYCEVKTLNELSFFFFNLNYGKKSHFSFFKLFRLTSPVPLYLHPALRAVGCFVVLFCFFFL